jgi:hypothetical protein
MSDEIVYLHTLDKSSQNALKRFKKGAKKTLSDQTKKALDAALNHCKCFKERAGQRADPKRKEKAAVKFKERAEEDFQAKWERIKDSLTQAKLRKEFAGLHLGIDQNRALRQPIQNSTDFTFHLTKESEEALLELLRSKPTSSAARSGASKQGAPAVETLEQADDEDFDTAIRRLQLESDAAWYVAESNRFSYDRELWLWDEKARKAAKGRVLACRCDQGRQWSVTFRVTQMWPDKGPSDIFLNEIGAISKLLGTIIFPPGSAEPRGLVVLAGRTGSCKSQIAQKLIESCLKDASSKHLPTFEDPIERTFDIPGVDYTPREKGKDVSNLAEAINNALRQKPAALFIGETREAAEWKLLLKFAGTGHLVITTAHAGSLVEAMGNILQAARADDPAARSLVGERLLAVIHLKPEKIKIKQKPDKTLNILIPTLWHRTPEGIKSLMAEGLSSLVPNTPKTLSAAPSFSSSIGRYWFARELLKDERVSTDDLKKLKLDKKDKKSTAALEDIKAEIKTDALEWDLEGT